MQAACHHGVATASGHAALGHYRQAVLDLCTCDAYSDRMTYCVAVRSTVTVPSDAMDRAPCLTAHTSTSVRDTNIRLHTAVAVDCSYILPMQEQAVRQTTSLQSTGGVRGVVGLVKTGGQQSTLVWPQRSSARVSGSSFYATLAFPFELHKTSGSISDIVTTRWDEQSQTLVAWHYC